MNWFVNPGTGLPVVELPDQWFTYERVFDDTDLFFIESYLPLSIPQPQLECLQPTSAAEVSLIVGLPEWRIVNDLLAYGKAAHHITP